MCYGSVYRTAPGSLWDDYTNLRVMQSVFVHAPADAVRAICRTKLRPMLLLSEREGLISGRCTAPRSAYYYLSASQEPVFASVCVNNVEPRRRGPQVRLAL